MNRKYKPFYYFILVVLVACSQPNKSDDVQENIAEKAPTTLSLTSTKALHNDPYNDTMHWALERIDIIMRCRDLGDSANNRV